MTRKSSLIQVFLILFLILGFCTDSFAQSNDQKTMTITIETIDEVDQKHVKKLKFIGEDADVSKVDEIVDDHLTGNEKSVNVNVEIEATSDSDTTEINLNGKQMDIRVEGDKVYIDEEEVEEGSFGDKTVRIIQMDDIDNDEIKEALEELNIEDLDGDQILFIETEIETEEAIGSDKGFLGVYKSNANKNEDEGVVVGGVTIGLPAEKAGIQKGDVIIKINGVRTNSFGELAKLIEAEKPGNTVDITYRSGDVTENVEVTLTDQPNRRQAFRWQDIGSTHPKGERRYKYKDSDKEDAFLRGGRNRSSSRRSKSNCSKNNSCRDSDQDCCKRRNTSNNKARLGVGIAEGQGARIISVNKKSAASKAGILVGDDIIKLDKEVIGSTEELIKAMSSYEPGDQVKVTYLRKGKKIKSKIVLDKTEVSCCAPNGKRSNKIERQRIIIKKNKKDNSAGEAEMRFENNLKVDDLDVYPNPTSSEMNFKFTIGKKNPTEFKIVDMTGQEVFSDKIENFTGTYETTFDFSNLSEGMYFFQINQDGKNFSEKIMYSKD